MNKYGIIAVDAAIICTKEKCHPNEAWLRAARKVFDEGSSSLIKGCPKNTFLGLCEEGHIKDIPSGSYTKSVKNKLYGLEAINLININNELLNNKTKLWNLVVKSKKHNSQMDVVMALYKANLMRDM